MSKLLEGYIDRHSLAAELGVTWRTIARYEDQPDGLPSVLIGGRRWYRREAVREWLHRRERKPNPRRSTRRVA